MLSMCDKVKAKISVEQMDTCHPIMNYVSYKTSNPEMYSPHERAFEIRASMTMEIRTLVSEYELGNPFVEKEFKERAARLFNKELYGDIITDIHRLYSQVKTETYLPPNSEVWVMFESILKKIGGR